MSSDLNQLARDIINHNEYLSLATCDKDGKPWISILAYSFDDHYNFYFCSLPTARHSSHIVTNPNVSFSIYDSHQEFGTGVGLQIEGQLTEAKEDDYPKIQEVYLGRKYPYGNVNNDFMNGLKVLLENKVYRFYKLEVQRCWINDPNADTDKRVEVMLK
jgi:uncharacterized pyridoxamine 5'-phosphate oxidase family protein